MRQRVGGWDFPSRSARAPCARPARARSLSGWGDAQAAASRSSRDVQDEPLPVSFLDRYLVDPRPRVGN
jgi:hypothetical protein